MNINLKKKFLLSLFSIALCSNFITLFAWASSETLDKLLLQGLRPDVAREVITAHPEADIDSRNSLLLRNRFIQNLIWEQKFNCSYMEKPSCSYEVPALGYDLSTAIVNENASEKALHDTFIDDSAKFIYFPVHPFNESPSVPGYTLLKNGNKNKRMLRGYMTASRTMYMVDPISSSFTRESTRESEATQRVYALKVGTDHILSSSDRRYVNSVHYQPSKVKVDRDEVITSRTHSDYMEEMDKALAQEATALREPFGALPSTTENGMVVRDITPLAKEYYLPALSIPYFGKVISDRHKTDYKKFWGEHYAQELGKAKAQLLLRYGMQMYTPNPQNMLIKLDPVTLMPSKIIFRDLADAYFVEPVAKHLPFAKAAMDKDRALDPHMIQSALYSFWDNSAWRFDEGPNALSASELKTWREQYYKGYIDEIARTLKIPASKIAPLTSADPDYDTKITTYFNRI